MTRKTLLILTLMLGCSAALATTNSMDFALEPLTLGRDHAVLNQQFDRLTAYAGQELSSQDGALFSLAAQKSFPSQWVIAKRVQFLIDQIESQALQGQALESTTKTTLLTRIRKELNDGLFNRYDSSLAALTQALKQQSIDMKPSDVIKAAQGLALYDDDEYLSLIVPRAEDTSIKLNAELLTEQLNYFANLASAGVAPDSEAARQIKHFISMWTWGEVEKTQALGWFAIVNLMRQSQPMVSTDILVQELNSVRPLKPDTDQISASADLKKAL